MRDRKVRTPVGIEREASEDSNTRVVSEERSYGRICARRMHHIIVGKKNDIALGVRDCGISAAGEAGTRKANYSRILPSFYGGQMRFKGRFRLLYQHKVIEALPAGPTRGIEGKNALSACGERNGQGW
jgi:hypothetical protein